MQKYTQLSLENRHQIKALLDAGHNRSEIARTIGVHRNKPKARRFTEALKAQARQWLTEEKLSPGN